MKRSAYARLWGVPLCVLVAAGCASLAELSNLRSRIQDTGYTGISVNRHTSNGFDTPAVAAYNLDQRTDDGETIFRLVWDTYPEEVDRVVVTVNDETRSATEDELHKAYGPRKVQPTGDSGSGAVVAWVLLVAFLAVGALITAVIAARRSHRRSPTGRTGARLRHPTPLTAAREGHHPSGPIRRQIRPARAAQPAKQAARTGRRDSGAAARQMNIRSA